MVCLGFEPGAAGWKARTNPLSYGGTPKKYFKAHSDYCNSAVTSNLRSALQ